jgi:hypothetical protein
MAQHRLAHRADRPVGHEVQTEESFGSHLHADRFLGNGNVTARTLLGSPDA